MVDHGGCTVVDYIRYRAPFPRLVLLLFPAVYAAMLSAIIGQVANIITSTTDAAASDIAMIVGYAAAGAVVGPKTSSPAQPRCLLILRPGGQSAFVEFLCQCHAVNRNSR